MAKTTSPDRVKELMTAGAHFGFIKARRHPSAKPYILGVKDNVEIFDLEKTEEALENAAEFARNMGKENAPLIFVGGKSEAREAVEKSGKAVGMPFVSARWIGGTLTNFPEIKKRLAKLEELLSQKEKGELAKYTKKERLLIDRDIAKLTVYFGGIAGMKAIPKFLVVIDPKKEHIAVSEAKKMKIPLVALAGSDTNLHEIDYPVPANDASKHTIAYVLERLTSAYNEGQAEAIKKEDK